MLHRRFAAWAVAAALALALTAPVAAAPVYEYKFYPVVNNPRASAFQLGENLRLRISQSMLLPGVTAINFDFRIYSNDGTEVQSIYFDDVLDNLLWNTFTTGNQGTRWAINNALGTPASGYTGPSASPADLPGWNNFPLCQAPNPACPTWSSDFGADTPGNAVGIITPAQAVRITLALQPGKGLTDVINAIKGNGVNYGTSTLWIGLKAVKQGSQSFVVFLNPTPEPATFSLLGAGLALMAGLAYRRRKR
jgi:hypothetical protein